MRDDELETWRRAWHSQPAVPIDLIRKVERQTVYMRLSWIPQILPAMIGVATIVGAVATRDPNWVVLACGVWLLIAVAWRFMVTNKRGVWKPSAETTSAYVELSVERCRRTLARIRFGNAMAVILTAFVLVLDYRILVSQGALNTRSDYVSMIEAFAFSILIVGIVLAIQVWKRRKTGSELQFLLNLQRQLHERE